jgi:uncharacterized protein (DUF2147 family)
MKHRAVAPALSVLAAALFATGSPSEASAADPSGIWVNNDGSAKVEIKKCGRGICSKIVWLKHPKDSQGKPLHDVRNEDSAMRDRPIIGLPLFRNMTLTEPNTWVGNAYNPEEGHIYTDVKVTLVSRQQIVLRGCKAWLLCGEKMWTRSQLPPSPTASGEPIEVTAPAELSSPDKAEPRSAPKLEAPIVEAFREREPLSAPGIAFVTTAASREPLPLSGENVSSMIAMTRPSPVATTAEPTLTNVVAAEEQDPPAPVRLPGPQPKAQAAAQAEAGPAAVPSVVKPKPKPVVREAQEQWPWLQRRSALLVSTRTGAQAEAGPAAAPSVVRPKPKPVVREAQEQWPWLQRRSALLVSTRTGAQAEAPAPAAPSFVKPKPKPVVRKAQEQWPWLQRRSALLVSTRTGG